MSRMSLPGGPNDITPEWLTAALRESGTITHAAVATADVDIIGQEWGFTGIVARVRMRYSVIEDGAPTSLVVKLPAATRDIPSTYRAATHRDAMAARRYLDRCAREIAFYRDVAPVSPMSVPRMYYGTTDDATGRVILLLEDLGCARVGDALEGCSSREAALVVDQLAAFHARWWDHPLLDTFTWLPSWSGDPWAAQQRYARLAEPFLARFGQRIPSRVREIIVALRSSYGALRVALTRAPATMIHGDLHLDNILFHPLGHEPALTVIDWQTVARGRGAVDLALFIFGSLEVAVRRDNEHDLFRRYHELLIAAGVTGYTSDRLLADCRLALLWQLAGTVTWLGSAAVDDLAGRERDLVEAVFESNRLFAAVLDHDAGALLPLH